MEQPVVGESSGRVFTSTEDIERALGEQFRRARLAEGLSQSELARTANISVNAVKTLERGGGSTLRTVTRVARALGVVDSWLLTLAPQQPLSPLDILRARGLLREPQRAPRRAPEDKAGS